METLVTFEGAVSNLHMLRSGEVAYGQGDEIFVLKVGDQPRSFGSGDWIDSLGNDRYILSDKGILYLVEGGKRSPVKAKGDLVKSLLKLTARRPVANADGTRVVFCAGGITKPDTWGEREYFAILDLSKNEFEILDMETYGGFALFFPKRSIFLLNTWEYKGGYIYILDEQDNLLGQFIGTSPSVSPNGSMIAFRKEGSITIVKEQGEDWAITDRKSQPDQGMGSNFNPPVWLNDDQVVYDSEDKLFRFDLSKNNAKTLQDIPGFVFGRATNLVGPIQGRILTVVRDQGNDSLVGIAPSSEP